jgi:hypothetical protein
MKKLLIIILTLFSLHSFAQDTTIYVKVRGIPGAYNFSKSGDSLIFYVAGERHALSVGSTVDLSNYYNKTQVDNSLNGKLDTSYKQSITAIKPLHWNIITPDSATIGLYVDTTSDLSDGSDTTVTTSKAVKNYVDGYVPDVTDIIALENYTGNSNTVIVRDSLRGGVFNYVTNATPDSGTVFKRYTGGYWQRQFDGKNVYVTWFGAKPDTVTDCTNAIQLAINSIDYNQGHSGGTVWFSSGTFITSSPIYLGNKVNLRGSGFWSSTIQLANSANCSMFQTPATGVIGYISIADLELQGNDVNNTTGNCFSFLSTSSNRSDIYFDKLLIAHFAGDGIYIESGWQYHINSCIIEFFGGNPIHLKATSTASTGNIRRVFIQNNAIFKSGTTGNSYAAFLAEGASDKLIYGIQFLNNTVNNKSLSDKLIHLKGVVDFNIVGNRITAQPEVSTDTTSEIIRIDSSSHLGIISGNTIAGDREFFNSNLYKPKYGIAIRGGSYTISSIANRFSWVSNNYNIGASTYNIDTSTVYNYPNIFTNNGYTGIRDSTPTFPLQINQTAANQISFDSLGHIHLGVVGNSQNSILNIAMPEPALSFGATINLEDTRPVAVGIGSRILLGGTYTGTSLTGGATIGAYKERVTSGDYGFSLALGSRANGSPVSNKVLLTGDGRFMYLARPKLSPADSLGIYSKVQVDSVFTNVGANVASASSIIPTGNTFHVTGTTTITSITATNIKAGQVITIIFDGILTFTDGSNLKLAGNFTTSADATITLRYDGSNFYEMSRSIN